MHTVRAAVTLGRVRPSSMVTLRQLWGGENSRLRNDSSSWISRASCAISARNGAIRKVALIPLPVLL